MILTNSQTLCKNRQKPEMLELLQGHKRSNLPLLVLHRLLSAAIFFGLNQQTFSIQRLILENKKQEHSESICQVLLTCTPAAAVSARFQLRRRTCLQWRVNEYRHQENLPNVSEMP